MFYFLSIVQGVSTSYLIYPMMLTAHCPKCPSLLLPTMSIDRQRGQSIVVDNGHWQARFQGHCVVAMVYLLYVRAGCSRSGITNTEYQPQHNRQCNTLNLH
ncbi:unnamed protein product, partial [Laminaria digitata]